MRPVRRREGVVDIGVAERGERLRECRVVGFFALVEAQIFEQRDLARLEGGNNPLRLGADAVRREIYRPPDRPAQRLDERAQRQFRVRPLGPAEMR